LAPVTAGGFETDVGIDRVSKFPNAAGGADVATKKIILDKYSLTNKISCE
jgi:hypothetical protein